MQLAGSTRSGDLGDGFPASNALMNKARGICTLPGGDLVVADSGNHRLRLLSKDLNIYAFAGSGVNGFGGDGGG